MPHTRSSEALLTAAVGLIAENGIDALTLSQVAERAGVGRATAYREFGDKDGLLSSVARHEIAIMAAETFRDVAPDAAPADLVATVIINALRFLRGHTAFTYVRDHEPHWLLHAALLVDATRMDIVQTVAATVTPIMGISDSPMLALPTPQAAEIVVRTVLSHSLMPTSTLTDRQVADAVARAIVTT